MRLADGLSGGPFLRFLFSSYHPFGLSSHERTAIPPSLRLLPGRSGPGFRFQHGLPAIIDLRDRSLYAYEALVRGTDGSGAASVLARVNDQNRYAFDQACRVKAVELAARLGMPCRLSINFLPNAVYRAATCIRATLAAARRFGFPTERIIFEITESEQLVDKAHLKEIIEEYQRQKFMTAIDDFGAGYSGLNLLAEFQPDIIKLDMALVRGIDTDRCASHRAGDSRRVPGTGDRGDRRGHRNPWRAAPVAGAGYSSVPGLPVCPAGLRGAAAGELAGA